MSLSTILSNTTETTTAQLVKLVQPVLPAPPKTNLIPPPKCLLPAPLPRVVLVPRVAPPSSPTVTPPRRSPQLAARTPLAVFVMPIVVSDEEVSLLAMMEDPPLELVTPLEVAQGVNT